MKTFFCIDMKSFYASVECADRGLDPFETPLVVADATRGENALCLAVTPKMKALGVRNRCRLREIPLKVRYEIVPPRMQRYIEYAAEIYGLYLTYFSPDDMHVYSIDESFIDATPYLKYYGLPPKALASYLLGRIAGELHIPAVAGVGSNLYLAKIAMDITAKKTKERVASLNEEEYRRTLWDHRPITDFWMISKGTASALSGYGIFTMRQIAEADEGLLYRRFGKDAELLIDHAYGRESCLMEDIKRYRSRSRSLSRSQILPRDYSVDEAVIVMKEMVQNLCRELIRQGLITGKVSLCVGYSGERAEPSKGAGRLLDATNLAAHVWDKIFDIWKEVVRSDVPVRRLGLAFEDLKDEAGYGYNLFEDPLRANEERAAERAAVELTYRYGKNAVLRGTNLLPGATQRERNEMIGGHRAGYDDAK